MYITIESVWVIKKEFFSRHSREKSSFLLLQTLSMVMYFNCGFNKSSNSHYFNPQRFLCTVFFIAWMPFSNENAQHHSSMVMQLAMWGHWAVILCSHCLCIIPGWSTACFSHPEQLRNVLYQKKTNFALCLALQNVHFSSIWRELLITKSNRKKERNLC